MQAITLHNTNTEEIIGMVTPVEPMDFDKFLDLVRESFIKFHKSDEFMDGDYSIEDFVDYHNEHNEIKIDWVLNDFIQLGDSDIE